MTNSAYGIARGRFREALGRGTVLTGMPLRRTARSLGMMAAALCFGGVVLASSVPAAAQADQVVRRAPFGRYVVHPLGRAIVLAGRGVRVAARATEGFIRTRDASKKAKTLAFGAAAALALWHAPFAAPLVGLGAYAVSALPVSQAVYQEIMERPLERLWRGHEDAKIATQSGAISAGIVGLFYAPALALPAAALLGAASPHFEYDNRVRASLANGWRWLEGRFPDPQPGY